MKNRIYWWLAACMVLVLGISVSVPAMSDDTGRPGFTEADQAFYLDEELYTFIRPGLEFELLDFEIPSDRQPLVTFSIKDPGGLPLDLAGIYTPGPIDIRFILSYIPSGETQKINYHGVGGRDRDGVYTDMGDGVFTYKFGTVLPAGYDVDATHTLASVATRDLREWADQGLTRYYDNDVFDFVPSGAAPMPRDIVTTETCNRCHNPLGEHGGRYQEVGVCQQCHNPSLEEDGVSYSFDQMVHRIHASVEPLIGEIEYPTAINNCEVCHTGGTPTAAMPLVANPNPTATCDGKATGKTELSWADVGAVEIRLNSPTGKMFTMGNGAGSKETGNWVKDGQKFMLLQRSTGQVLGETDVDLTVYGCAGNPPYAFVGEAGTLHSNWMTNPTIAACGSCHVNVNFATGEGHDGGAWDDDEFCAFCHEADSGMEFDRSVRGAHTVLLRSTQLNGVLLTIKQVNNTGPGQSPTVRFSLTNKNGLLNPAALETLTFTLTGPNDDFEVNIRENALGKVTQAGSGNDWVYAFNAVIPADAEGSYSVGAEGRITVMLNGVSVRDSMENPVVAVAVTDAEPVARRLIVDDAKCEGCHANLSLHGDNRKNANVYCQTCHMPDETDDAVRLEGLDESIHFKYMVHKIHRGADLENGYVVYGFRSSVHDYSHVGYPGDLRDCEACHIEGTYGLPTPAGALPTNSPNTFLTTMGPDTASCLSCHDGLEAAAHAQANTSPLGESCAACHGEDKTYSVERVHAR